MKKKKRHQRRRWKFDSLPQAVNLSGNRLNIWTVQVIEHYDDHRDWHYNKTLPKD